MGESKALLEREAHLDEATPAELEATRLRVVAALGAAALPSIPTGHEAGSGSLAQAAVTGVSLKVVGSALLAAVGTSALLLSLNGPAAEPGALDLFPESFIGVTPQGFLRQIDDAGRGYIAAGNHARQLPGRAGHPLHAGADAV